MITVVSVYMHNNTGLYTGNMIFTQVLFYSSDIDECELGTHTCNSNASCADTDGSFNCTCGEGFEGDGFICTGMQMGPTFHRVIIELLQFTC